MADERRPSPLALVLILSAIFFILFLAVSGSLFMYGRSGSFRNHSFGGLGEGAVGVVELKGVILHSKKMLARLQRAGENDRIKAVVLRIDSPGGAVAPSQEIYEAIRNFKKPIVVSMASVSASGAFYVACGAPKVFANPGTITGSIGVIMEFADLEKLYQWAKINRYVVKTGKFKDIGAEYRPMSPEERELLQTMENNVLLQFERAIATGRKLPLATVQSIADGRIFSGSQAKALNLVDALGGIQDAIEEAGRLAKIKGKPDVIYLREPRKNLLDYLLSDVSRGQADDEDSRSDLSGLATVARFFLGHLDHPIENSTLGFVPGVYWLWNGNR